MKRWIMAAGGAAVVAAVCQIIYGVYHWKRKSAMAVSIIGGADGPTSVFIAGKIPSGFYAGTALCGVVILIALVTAFLIWKWRQK